MSRIREIYKGLVQGTAYMNELSKETENEIAELLNEELQSNQQEYEQYRDKLYSAAAVAEESGFIKGFHFASELFAECGLKSQNINVKS